MASTPGASMDNIYDNMREVAADYDAFVLDAWGVIHDGQNVYPGAVECMTGLMTGGKKVLVLSNTPSTSKVLVSELASRGCTQNLYSDLVTSGEVTRQEILAWAKGKSSEETRYLYIGPSERRALLDETPCKPASVLEEASFILVAGFDDGLHELPHYEELLQRAYTRKVPMYCANPDRAIITMKGEVIPCAGTLANRYEAIGGPVIYIGKPRPLIYGIVRERLGLREGVRAIAIGDGLATDVAGAQAAGIPALLLAGGIAVVEAGGADVDTLRAFCASKGIMPHGYLKRFAWE